MSDLFIEVLDNEGTDSVCRVLSEFLPDGAVVSLEGTLGAGKTRLVQGVAKYAGVEDGIVTSPTFVLVKEYEGEREIYHFDLYRLESESEFKQLDPEDYFNRNGITFIEWGNKFPQLLPKEILTIKIEITGESSRIFNFIAVGETFDETIEALKTHETVKDRRDTKDKIESNYSVVQ
ncbi:MAG: tRNA (adenosine(37)-N6)-threonylcarbamoyltransferase complex ATPase subunit type 1 TsaE [Planctomycetaceae bacterium]|jgi:tRNA threonylcarbamoyladenosine biosynthesis protein TsaE|nr:tRNA (adenosine(37)-N6)-threonylcarbamoyltransferase complex ATPase subunit type 1 TsaE [Planctomycetaceae bacterium]